MVPVSAQLEREALRLSERYAVEIVEAFNLCPWARDVRLAGRLARAVCGERDPIAATEWGARQIAELSPRTDVDVGLLVFPRITLKRSEFHELVSELEKHHARVAPKAVVAMADFHPDAELNAADAGRLVPFLRRTPFPTVQFIRRDVLAAARKTTDEGSGFADGLSALTALTGENTPKPSVSNEIARGNLRTVERGGAVQIEAVFADICRDRDQSLARIDA